MIISAERYYTTLKNKVRDVSVIKGFDKEEQHKILTSARKNIITSINQKTSALQILKNINENRANARDVHHLVFSKKGPLPDHTCTDLGMEPDIEEQQ